MEHRGTFTLNGSLGIDGMLARPTTVLASVATPVRVRVQNLGPHEFDLDDGDKRYTVPPGCTTLIEAGHIVARIGSGQNILTSGTFAWEDGPAQSELPEVPEEPETPE